MHNLVNMRHSKNNNGFTLIEVMITVAILGILLTPLFILHSSNLSTLAISSTAVQRIIAARNFVVDTYVSLSPDTRTTTIEKKITNPLTVFTYELKDKVHNKELAALKGLCQENITMRWHEYGRPRQESLIAFCYKKEERKE